MTEYQFAKRYRHFMGQLEADENGDYMLVSEYQAATKTVYDTLRIVQETSIAHAAKQNDLIRVLKAALSRAVKASSLGVLEPNWIDQAREALESARTSKAEHGG